MELKTRYQYTYFIYPYIIQENQYSKYVLKLLNNNKFKLRIFQKERDFDVYTYFLPKIREYMFSSFRYKAQNVRNLAESKNETESALLAKEPCIIFDYDIEEDIQGKTQVDMGIFFKIRKMELICFNTGICFLCIKTYVEDIDDFANILNFNYKFRELNQDSSKLNSYDQIRVQTNTFKDIKTIKELIQDITGTNYSPKLNIDMNKFLTFSYVCIDQDAWNYSTNFDDISDYFTKYINVLPNDNLINHAGERVTVVSKWKYAKIGITKQGVSLFASTADINCYTRLPEEFETIYLYTYIFTLYKKIYLKKISEKFQRSGFVEFTKRIWVQEITSDSMGTTFYLGLKEALELDEMYYKIKYKYDILFKELKLDNEKAIRILLYIVLLISVGLNVMTFMAFIRMLQ